MKLKINNFFKKLHIERKKRDGNIGRECGVEESCHFLNRREPNLLIDRFVERPYPGEWTGLSKDRLW